MKLPSARKFWLLLAGFAVLEILSWLAYTNMATEQGVAIAVLIVLLIVAWKKPTWLAYASIAELVVGSKGYLIFLTMGGAKVSLRMMLFVFVLGIALPHIIRQWSSLQKTILSRSYIFFILWLVIGVLFGIYYRHPFGTIYSDANAFIYVALLPSWWILLRRDPDWKTTTIAILLAGATMIGFKSWLMVLLFGRDLSFLHQLYTWVRNTGVGEITLINNNVYRVFFQSQIYTVLAFLFSLVIWATQRPARWWIIPVTFSALGVYISLSRSFWLGVIVALLVFIVLLLKQRAWKKIARLWILLPIGIFSWAMMIWAISFPAFSLHGQANAVVSRFNGTGSASAATARRNQIKPLFSAIAQHPVLGSGLGKTVTYFSTDPTIHGNRTTTAFELGYLDLWLKLGLVGVTLYAWWIFGLWKKFAQTIWGMPFIIAGAALVVIHLTSPYLNHPLGLGWLMLTSLFAYDAS